MSEVEVLIRAKEIRMISIEEVEKYINPKNRNKHPESQIDNLVKIITYSGFRRPPTVSTRSNILVCGEGRYLAAKKVGMKVIPVMFQDYDSYDQEYADGIADNALDKQAELDFAAINADLVNLDGATFDIDWLGIKDFKIDVSETAFPELSGADPGFQQRTFILSNEQNDILNEALAKAEKEEDCSDEINENKNGNILIAGLKRYVHG